MTARRMALTGWLLVWGIGAAWAADPYLGYLYPAGGTAGTTVRVIAGGQYLGGIRAGVADGGGVRIASVTPVPGFPAPDGRQRKYLQNCLLALADGKPLPTRPADTEAWRRNAWWESLDQLDALALSIVARDLYTPRNALQSSPAIRQLLILEIEIAADAAPGWRELRLWGRGCGVTPPRLFRVDRAPHREEPRFTPPKRPATDLAPQPLPVVLDGQIMPGETDRFPVVLKGGERYEFRLYGRKLQPFIGDAVPGHFQPVLRLLDPAGAEAAFADDRGIDPDPVLGFRAAADGVYTLEVRDNLYRGRADFVYLVSAAAAPPETPPERDPAERRLPPPEQAPEAAGVLAEPGAAAVFRFAGRAGERIVAEVTARRDGSPLDGVLRLYAPDGTPAAGADDRETALNVGEWSDLPDPRLEATLPADGEYRLELRDRTGGGGALYGYRLEVRRPRPDFAVYTCRSAWNGTAGKTVEGALAVERRDGFDGPIRVFCEDFPAAKSAEIAAGASSGVLSIPLPLRTRPTVRPFRLIAEAECGGVTVRHPVIPADRYNQAFAYDHLLPARELWLGILPPSRRAAARPRTEAGKIPQSGPSVEKR